MSSDAAASFQSCFVRCCYEDGCNNGKVSQNETTKVLRTEKRMEGSRNVLNNINEAATQSVLQLTWKPIIQQITEALRVSTGKMDEPENSQLNTATTLYSNEESEVEITTYRPYRVSEKLLFPSQGGFFTLVRQTNYQNPKMLLEVKQ